MQEEALDVLVFDVFAFGEDAEHGERRKIGNFAQLVQNLRHEVLLTQLGLHKIFEGVNPQVDLIGTVLLAQIDDVLVSVASDVEIEEVFAHAEVLAEHHYSLIEVVHFEERKQHVVVWLLGCVAQLL